MEILIIMIIGFLFILALILGGIPVPRTSKHTSEHIYVIVRFMDGEIFEKKIDKPYSFLYEKNDLYPTIRFHMEEEHPFLLKGSNKALKYRIINDIMIGDKEYYCKKISEKTYMSNDNRIMNEFIIDVQDFRAEWSKIMEYLKSEMKNKNSCKPCLYDVRKKFYEAGLTDQDIKDHYGDIIREKERIEQQAEDKQRIIDEEKRKIKIKEVVEQLNK